MNQSQYKPGIGKHANTSQPGAASGKSPGMAHPMAMAREVNRLGRATVCRVKRFGSAAALRYWLATGRSQYKPCIGKHANNSG